MNSNTLLMYLDKYTKKRTEEDSNCRGAIKRISTMATDYSCALEFCDKAADEIRRLTVENETLRNELVLARLALAQQQEELSLARVQTGTTAQDALWVFDPETGKLEM